MFLEFFLFFFLRPYLRHMEGSSLARDCSDLSWILKLHTIVGTPQFFFNCMQTQDINQNFPPAQGALKATGT